MYFNFQVTKSSINFWNSLELTWQQCADLHESRWATSVAELDGKVYVAVKSSTCDYLDPLMYDSYTDQWFILPSLPYARFSLVTIPNVRQLLAIGGSSSANGIVTKVSNKVFLWDAIYRKWLNCYPNMSIARWLSSSISHRLKVIVAGGVTCANPLTITRAVEVLHINSSYFSDSYWSVVKQLPYGVYEAVPLIINNDIYIAAGFNDNTGTCSIATASLPELVQSSNNSTSSSNRVWNKLPDMPYCSLAINQYQGHLITFSGDYELPLSNKITCALAPQIHVYNADTKSWDCVGEIPNKYYLGRSIHINDHEILFITGLTGSHDMSKEDNLMPSCLKLTLV